MAIKLADAIVAMAADVEGLRADLNKAQTATAQTAGDMEKRTSSMGEVMKGVFQGIGQGIVGLAANALQSAKAYVSDAIGAASDLGETTSKVGVLFGDGAGDIQKWASTADVALGQSKQQAMDAASGFAIFGKAAGMSGQDLSGFATKMTGLSSDLASFNNTSPEQAIEAIGAALRGESEPIRAYGVMLNDASIKAQALSMGLVKGEVDTLQLSRAQEALEKAQRKVNEATKKYGADSTQAHDAVRDLDQAEASLAKVIEGKIPDLTQQQKLMAVQAAIYAQTTAAQGDFARTSAGAANQQRILDAQLANLKTTVGDALLPVWVLLISTLNQFVQDVLPPVANFLQTVITPAIKAVVDVLTNYIGAVRDAGAGSSEAEEALGLFPAALQPVISFITTLIGGLGSLAGSIGELVTAAVGWFGSFSSSVKEDGIEPLGYLKDWIDENLPRIQLIIETVLAAIQTFWRNHGDTVLQVVNTSLKAVLLVFDTVLKTIGGAITLVLQVITGDWRGAGETLIGISDNLWRLVKGLFQAGLDVLKAIVPDALRWLLGDWRTHNDDVSNNVSGGWASIRSYYNSGLDGVKGFLSSGLDWMLSQWQGHHTQRDTATSTAWSALQSAYSTALTNLRDGIVLSLQLMNGDWSGATETIRGIVDRSWETLRTLFGNQIDGLRSIFANTNWGGLGSGIVNGIANGIRNGAYAIAEAAKQAASNALQAAKNFLGIRSPSRRAADEIGAPLAEGVAEGARSRMGNLTDGLQEALQAMMDGLIAPTTTSGGSPSLLFDSLQRAVAGIGASVPVGSPLLAGAPAVAGNQTVNISLSQYFYGQTEPVRVKDAANLGILDSLRQAGLR